MTRSSDCAKLSLRFQRFQPVVPQSRRARRTTTTSTDVVSKLGRDRMDMCGPLIARSKDRAAAGSEDTKLRVEVEPAAAAAPRERHPSLQKIDDCTSLPPDRPDKPALIIKQSDRRGVAFVHRRYDGAQRGAGTTPVAVSAAHARRTRACLLPATSQNR
jgi:hypothetical protein